MCVYVCVIMCMCVCVSLCVFMLNNPFLPTQNHSNMGYRLPQGWVQEGETPSVAAHRLCMEEAGLDVTLKVLYINIYVLWVYYYSK